MTMAEQKMLRGHAPMTVWRGANGAAGGNLYRGGLVDPRMVDAADRDRLVAEGFLQWVVREGEGWKLAEDSGDAEAGTPVTVGDAGIDNPDPGERATAIGVGQVDSDVIKPVQTSEADARRAAAQAKLPADGSVPDGRSGKEVFVEYLANRGYSYEELSKQDKPELVSLAQQASGTTSASSTTAAPPPATNATPAKPTPAKPTK